jgi:hypothetical protein
MMSVLEVFQWFEYSPLLTAMRASPWLFPVIATFHLLGLVLIGAAVLIVDLRLLGLGLSRHPAADLARQTDPLLRAGLVIMFATGLFLLMCFGTKYYYLTAFWLKLAAFFAVLIFASTVHRRMVMTSIPSTGNIRSRITGVVSLLLWSIVMLCGRLIGFP